MARIQIRMDWVTIQYLAYIAGSVCFLVGSGIGILRHWST